jgi:hypothetical protein
MSTLKHNSVMLNLIQHLLVKQKIPIRQLGDGMTKQAVYA